MRIIIDIGHPAHVHLFRNFGKEMLKRGHNVLFTCRDREHIQYLLSYYCLDYVSFGRHYKTIFGKIFSMLVYLIRMIAVSLKFKPDIYLSHGSICAAQASFFFGKPHIAMEDTFNKEQLMFSMPFTDVVLTGDYPHPSLGRKEIRYPGFHELAYLHPRVFSADKKINSVLGLREGEKYMVLRFIAFDASHDVGHKGISLDNKIRITKTLSQYLRVFISSEDMIPDELSSYKIEILPEKMLDVLASAHLFIGESGTMASECAALSVPNIQVRHTLEPSKVPGIHLELVGRGLKYLFEVNDIDGILNKSLEIILDDSEKKNMVLNRNKMLNEMIDVTAFLCWFTENYPDSVAIIQNHPNEYSRFINNKF